MATWWEITFTGEPDDTDRERVAGLIREGYTSGQLIEDGPGLPAGEQYERIGPGSHRHRYGGQALQHSHPGGSRPHGYYEHPEDARG
jgi:hypothetical protein